MIIPIRCFTCGSVTGDKWTAFVETVVEEKNKSSANVTSKLDVQYIDINDDGKIQNRWKVKYWMILIFIDIVVEGCS